MSGNRSPSFGLLRNVLPSVPARGTDPDTDPIPASQDVTGGTSSVADQGREAIIEVAPIERSTAAVQQPTPIRSERLQVKSSLVARPGRNKAITRPSTFRLAIELQDALKAVADYNGLNMTDIVAESIWQHLQDFEWPNGSDDLRTKVSRLF